MIWYPIDSTETSIMNDQERLALFITAGHKIESRKTLAWKSRYKHAINNWQSHLDPTCNYHQDPGELIPHFEKSRALTCHCQNRNESSRVAFLARRRCDPRSNGSMWKSGRATPGPIGRYWIASWLFNCYLGYVSVLNSELHCQYCSLPIVHRDACLGTSIFNTYLSSSIAIQSLPAVWYIDRSDRRPGKNKDVLSKSPGHATDCLCPNSQLTQLITWSPRAI
jgi:hypothetical protein